MLQTYMISRRKFITGVSVALTTLSGCAAWPGTEPSNDGDPSSVSLRISNNDDDPQLVNIRIENEAGMKLYEVEKRVPGRGEELRKVTLDNAFEMTISEQYYVHTTINGTTMKEYSDTVTCEESVIDVLIEYEPTSTLVDHESISYTSTTCS